MQIIRSRHRQPFTIVQNTVARDARLSFRARGVLLHMLSMEDGWRTNSNDLARQGPEGRDAVRTALRELADCGYLVRRTFKDGDSGLLGTVCELHDTPAENADSQSPGPENPSPVGFPENPQTGAWKTGGRISRPLKKELEEEGDVPARPPEGGRGTSPPAMRPSRNADEPPTADSPPGLPSDRTVGEAIRDADRAANRDRDKPEPEPVPLTLTPAEVDRQRAGIARARDALDAATGLVEAELGGRVVEAGGRRITARAAEALAEAHAHRRAAEAEATRARQNRPVNPSESHREPRTAPAGTSVPAPRSAGRKSRPLRSVPVPPLGDDETPF